MKRIILALALIASLQIAGAQDMVRKAASAVKALESAKTDAANPKKNTKLATWTKLGQAYMNAYNAPLGSGWIGAPKSDLDVLMSNERASATESVVVNGTNYTKVSYSNSNYYFNDGGNLSIIEITKPVCEDPLENALEAYKKAAELDVKGQKTKDISAAIGEIAKAMETEAYAAYSLGNLDKAAEMFEEAAEASATAPFSTPNNQALYYAGVVSSNLGNFEKTKEIMTKCLANGYKGDDGDVYAKLAEAYDKLGDKDSSKKFLEEGFQAYPQSQGILIGLINYYMNNNEDPAQLFSLLDKAKANEPNNASLYYVEGNIRKQLGDVEAAATAYDKSVEINPDYEFGYIGKGLLFYENAVKLSEQAQNELDDAKYLKLAEAFEKSLKDCIAPFEKAFEITKDNEIKASVAEYLKNACFRFRSDPEYQAKHDKYAEFAASVQ